MLNTTLSRPYTYVGPITYSTPELAPGTEGLYRCRAYVGPHHVADVTKSGPHYRVKGLYWGSEDQRTEDRREVPELVRLIGARTPWNPRDCRLDCQH